MIMLPYIPGVLPRHTKQKRARHHVDALLDEAQGPQCADEQHLVPYNLLNIRLF